MLKEKKSKRGRPKGSTKLTLKEVRAAFKKAGYTLLTKSYTGTKQVLKYKCEKCKTTRQVTFNNFARGTRCKECFLRSQMKETPRYIQLRDQYFTLTEVARILGLNYADMRKHVLLGNLPSPKKIVGLKAHYTEEDIREIESMVEVV